VTAAPLGSNSSGSLWNRWDPHIHCPGTLLNNQFSGDWEGYLGRIESLEPRIRALGVTDYFGLEGYRQVKARKSAGRLAEVELIFPNVELRLDIRTERGKALNVHLLFSPHDPNHEAEIERILAQLTFEFDSTFYSCSPASLVALGRAYKPTCGSDEEALREGANQFKVNFGKLREILRRERWLERNCLLGVSGTLSDGTSGIQHDDSFAASRREIEANAHLFFGGTPGLRNFWLGKKEGFPPAYIERNYRALKPCLHGSDAHSVEKVGAPDSNRLCWLKGDLTFETLRQAVIEPEERVWLGDSPPPTSLSGWVRGIRTSDATWWVSGEVPVNPGLVSIIGARGSGKTALVDILAAGAGLDPSARAPSSFLERAMKPVNLLRSAIAEVTWADGARVQRVLASSAAPTAQEEVCYLTQHFVERLCSSAGLAHELRLEIERVIFAATDPSNRLEADSFATLREIYTDPIQRRRTELDYRIEEISTAIADEDALIANLPSLIEREKGIQKELDAATREIASLIPKGSEERARKLADLEKACAHVEAKVERLHRRLLDLDTLGRDVVHTRDVVEPNRIRELKRRYAALALSEADWSAFAMEFVGDPLTLLAQAKARTEAEIKLTEDGDETSRAAVELIDQPLRQLRASRDLAKAEVGGDQQRQRRYGLLQQDTQRLQTSMRSLTGELERARSADPRRQELLVSRRDTYAQIFRNIGEEEDVLRELYSPLERELGEAQGALAKLRFTVRRRVDLKAWAEAGEALIDLRKDSAFRGGGSLESLAKEMLFDAWQRGTPQQIAIAVQSFLDRHREDLAASIPRGLSAEARRSHLRDIGAWLYSTTHLSIEYAIEYDGVAIEQLSPGTRGIVLLLLYLAIDKEDRRPLVIDQPEENLDPKSVYDELVPHFREARKRRQVIVVTHNANLVINTDADQVVVAESFQMPGGGLPRLSYNCGSLENPVIRKSVCEILEGGERAFLERERRYRLRWGDGVRVAADDETDAS
jgi:hypothetical protein